MVTAKATIGYTTNSILAACPYCGNVHRHSLPVGDGKRMADCFKGEYVLDFTPSEEQTEK